jgi:hypothetical protein
MSGGPILTKGIPRMAGRRDSHPGAGIAGRDIASRPECPRLDLLNADRSREIHLTRLFVVALLGDQA